MDGKHILVKKPPNTGSYYYNYKGTFSVVLFAIVNANYEFLYVHNGLMDVCRMEEFGAKQEFASV